MGSLDGYIKNRVIGKGSYGEVWLVKSKKDRKQYVLKKLDVHSATKRERKAAEQEAKLLSKLKHPNIVSYKDSFEADDGFLYIAMGYCEGGDVYTRLKEQKGTALAERQIVEWFVQIAMALQYMHERNILHRDLKTQNIFLTKSKIIKVGDLGIARVLDNSSDMATTLIGTPYYMSPELFSNKPYNHKSDVWALGCCVYEMATLKHAFNAKDMNSLVYKILRGKMPSMPKEYSSELVSLIKAMLNHNPDRRPSVNRILRDPYIKKNIAVFLEGTKKNRRPSSSSAPSSRRSSLGDQVDGGESQRSSASNASSANKGAERSRLEPVPRVEVDLEPLQVGPDLEPISEEAGTADHLDGSADSKRSSGGSSTPSNSQAQPKDEAGSGKARKKKRRFLQPSVEPKPVIISVEHLDHSSGSSPANSAKLTNSSDSNQKDFNAHKNNLRNAIGGDHVKPCASPSSSSSSSPSVARALRGESAQSKPRLQDASKPSSKAVAADSQRQGPDNASARKSVLDHLHPVSKPRPLPTRPSAGAPQPSAATPKTRLDASPGGRESGYASASVASSAAASQEEPPMSSRSSRDSGAEEMPRGPNLSARARRREIKDRETPRTSRSVEISRSRPAGVVRPSTAGSAGRSVGSAVDMVDGPVSRSSHSASPVPIHEVRSAPVLLHQAQNNAKSHPSSSAGLSPAVAEQAPYQRQRKQPSLAEESSSSSSEELEEGEVPEEMVKEKQRKREKKEMSNFISLLGTTLRMNKDEDKSDEDEPGQVAVTDDAGARKEKPKKVDRVGITYTKQTPTKVKGQQVHVPVIEESTREHAQLSNGGDGVASPPAAGLTMGTTGRLWERITMLRKDCIRGLGVEKLKQAYDILDKFEADELEPKLVTLLGKDDFDVYAGKIWQLKFCEEAAFGLI